ncbi:AAA family ATPase [Nocardia altamirensis]|uniref:AAA family ATPase n=1 Tax=Nocardia altamirensis TaxID=472158 RepID=UPI00084087C7|nr:AAA family ATPase [Nocardia altamirensis]
MSNYEAPQPDTANLLDGLRDGGWLDAQQFPPLAWCVEGIIPEGFGLLVAPPKAGKSWFVAGVGLACAGGGFALGRIPVQRRPVLYLALEDGHRRLQSRFRTLMANKPIPEGISVIIKARANQVVPMIAEYLIRHADAAPLVILDTLGKVRPPKQRGEDAYAADYAIGSQLKSAIDSAPGASLLVVHHTRKAESVDFVDAVSGTQGIAGSADFVLVLNRKRKSDQAVLSVTGRDVPENEYALVTDAGRWSLDGTDLMDAAATVTTRQHTANLGDRTADALAFVASRPLGTRATDLATHLGIGNDDAGKYLRRLHEKELIGKRTRGVYIGTSEVSERTVHPDTPSSEQQSLSDTGADHSDASAQVSEIPMNLSEPETHHDQGKRPLSYRSDTSDSDVTPMDAFLQNVAVLPPPRRRRSRGGQSIDRTKS